MTRTRLLTGTVLTAVVLAGACHRGSPATGGDTSPTRSGPPTITLRSIELAAARTTDARSSRMSIAAEIRTQASAGQVITEHGSGMFDYRTNVGSLTFDVDTGSAGAFAIELRFVGEAVYEKLPSFVAGLGGRRPWLKVDLSGSPGENAGGSSGFLSGNPADTLQYLRGESDRLTDVGHETVRGVPTEHYAVDVDLKRAAARLTESERNAFDRARKLFGRTSIPLDVWVDHTGLVRRIRLSLEMDLGPSGMATVVETIELFDFGVAVDVTEPPASEVSDLSSLGSPMAGASQS